MKSIPVPFGAAFLLPTQEIWLARLSVPKQLRGYGVGTLIVQHLQRLGRPIVLEAVADAGKVLALQAFYSRLGFKPTNSKVGTLRWEPG